MANNASAAKRRAKNYAILEKAKNKDEPVVDKDRVRLTLSMALNYYSANTTSKDQKAYAISYYKKKDKNIAVLLAKLPDHRFQTFGSICRLMDREVYEKEWYSESSWFDDKLAELLAAANKVQDVVEADEPSAPAAPVVTIQDRILAKARDHAAEIDGAIDEFITNGTEFDTSAFLKANEVNGPIAKRVGEFFISERDEIAEALGGKDAQLNEGYAHLGKRGLKKFLAFLNSIIDACEQQVQVAKVSRAPRKRKAVSPSKVVAKVKYMKEFEELKLKSILPVNMLESSEVWIYNTKYRRITRYQAVSGTLGVKGTTLIGFDTATSITLTLRKPEEFFKGLSVGKRALNSAIKAIKTKPGKPNGRINEDCIILGAF